MMSWVLMVTSNSERDQAVREDLEGAGFGVEIVADVDAAIECLAVMRPALLVVDDEVANADRLHTAVRLRVVDAAATIPIVTIPRGATTRSA